VGWILLILSIGPAILVSRDAVSTVLAKGYQALYQNPSYGLGAGAQILAALLVPSALFLLVGSKGSRRLVVLSAAIIVSYSLTQLFLGYRSTAVTPLLAYAWLWDRHIRRLPRTALLSTAAAFLFVVFPLIRVVRDTVGQSRLSLDFLAQAYATIHNPALSAISEMGNSMETVAYTLTLVPHARDFDFGVQYLYDSLSVIPNLFWTVHPTVAHGTLSGWLIHIVDPFLAAQAGGLGFSFIAEAYLNFAWFGAPLVLALIGYLLAKYVLWAMRSGDPAKSAAVAVFFVFAILWVRNEATDAFRPLIWYSLAPYCLAVLRSRGWGSSTFIRGRFRPGTGTNIIGTPEALKTGTTHSL
jgi:oligosaccharide repeat unit polymerase